jgi:hypothetical protein
LTGTGEPVGPWRMRRLAKRWGRAPVRAAAFVRRPDYVELALKATGPDIAAKVGLDPELREPASAAVQSLPDMQLLVLDQLQTLHLIGLEGWTLGRLGEELMQWPLSDVTVLVKPGKGKFRAVEICSGETRLLLAGPWKNASQRRALELIERESAAD